MGWLKKAPLVSLLFAVAMAAVPFVLAQNPNQPTARFDNAREAARDYFVRNPRLEVDQLAEIILDAGWLSEARAAADAADGSADVRLPPRLLARSQARLDGLLDDAYQARMKADPAWRLGVLDAQSPTENYIAHAFIHDAMPGVILCVLVLLLVGAPLERTWGSPIFAAFVLGAIPATAQAYRFLDASSGLPWSGGAGFAGALLGAYFIRGLGGHFLFPGWVLLPAWLGAETFIVRQFWIDDLTSVPWATLCASVGLGALVASVLRLISVEARVDEIGEKRRARGPHPVIARAARLRSDGDPYQAFDLMQAAWRDEPENRDVGEAFFSIAQEVGQPEAAADAILPTLRWLLRRGDVAAAIDLWFPLAERQCRLDLEPTGFVRLGEALLDAGHPEQALFSLRSALDAGVSSAHATRIVNIARDLDDGLAREAATIALADGSLDPKIRATLEPILAAAPGDAAAAPTPSPAQPELSRSQLDRRVQAEHQTVETTAFPLDHDDDFERGAMDAGFTGDLAAADPNEAALADQALDAGALSEEALAEEAPAADVDIQVPEDSGDVLSHWNDQSALDADALADVSGALEESIGEEDFLDPTDLEVPDMGFDFGLRDDLESADGFGDPLDDETDSDRTPMMDSTDELTSPMSEAGEDSTTAVFDQPTRFMASPSSESAPSSTSTPMPTPSPVATPQASAENDDFAFGQSASGEPPVDAQTRVMALRTRKVIDAVPVQAGDDWIEIDADGHGKSKLPISRIEAIAVAAINDLGPRPVLVLDFILNWQADVADPMKLIRFRSDRFDPMQFSPGASAPLDALTRWIAALEQESGAVCLPSRALLEGEFTRYATLDEYEREVLMAIAEGS